MSEPEAESAAQHPVEPFCAHATSPQWPEVEGCTYAVGLDGSKLSWMAFDFAMGMVVRRKKQEIDTVHILHIGAPDHKKNLVPAQLQPDKLKAETGQRNITYRVKNTEWVEKEREDGTTVGDTLVQMSDHMKPFPPNFLVLGSFGRKEKESVYLGHVPNALMKRSKTDVFIVKQAAELLPAQTNGAMVWVVGTDNSAHARHALDMALGLMQPQDKLFIFYAAKYESFARRVQAAQEEICAGAGREVEFTFQHVHGQQNYGDVLCQFAKEQGAHVLVIGHGGQSRKSTAAGLASTKQGTTEEQKKLGSVVERCCELASMSVLITKGTGRHDQIVDGDGSTKMGNEVGGGDGMAEAAGADSLAAGTEY